MKKRLASINRKMGTAGDKVKAKEAEMAAADPTDFVRLGELQAELNDLKAKKEAMEDEWLELAKRWAWSRRKRDKGKLLPYWLMGHFCKMGLWDGPASCPARLAQKRVSLKAGF